MKTISKVAIIAAGLSSGSIFAVPAVYASGDAPWCTVSQIGEGAEAWDCQYETVQECAQNIAGGNRGSCSPNPHAPDAPAAAAAPVPNNNPVSTTSGSATSRKHKEKSK
jgi:Protein of unknown function (DUF3551)